MSEISVVLGGAIAQGLLQGNGEGGADDGKDQRPSVSTRVRNPATVEHEQEQRGRVHGVSLGHQEAIEHDLHQAAQGLGQVGEARHGHNCSEIGPDAATGTHRSVARRVQHLRIGVRAGYKEVEGELRGLRLWW